MEIDKEKKCIYREIVQVYHTDLNLPHEIDHRLFDGYTTNSLHHHDLLEQDLSHHLIQHFA